MTTRIKVGIRVRPFLDSEKEKGYANSRVQIDEQTKEIMIAEDGRRERKTFKFDYVFTPNNNQLQVYEQANIDYLLNKVVEGYHCTIFAYGQTGSGKTHTMEGYEYELAPPKESNKEGGNSAPKPRPKQHQNPERFGIIPRAVSALFDKLKAKEGGEFNVTCSFLQIYNEKIYDLLNPNSIKQNSADGTPVLSQGLRLRWNQRDQFQVENLFVFDCKSAEEVMNFFHYGIRNRVTASHKLNMASSRSHTILTLKVESIDLSTQSSSFSKLELVDLAGSERIGQTGTEGKLAKESIDINKSLFILRQVITTLSDIHRVSNKQKDQYQHIPYRESKLTSLLKQSIGGNSYCLMLACINPNDSFIDENISTLNYASKATYIKNEPIRNDDPKNKVIKDLKQENNRLRFELDKANQHIQFVTNLNNSGSGFSSNHPPNCCLPTCQYGGGAQPSSELTPSQKARMSIAMANQE
ncbi:kinesin motor catalytic domain protein (macronuclear) [Tetrahymena thermophila SB210]|uniref:Kinesin-like protein n=1 Tax=Tetrahymena thermophila (strain SB210) TaxID=312017 RepID=I7LVH9_TETTS|nr:kinesin motor catalytic domain protein [Tetrahymena thermophila SB210]EAR98263.2 kinesin motor catalytic domain protein [Tetrahymena thermophila SB210]|eukprot:XP_001018508.2 kinesin motor catalytic domain protein [Tetrahymena thermophila SB210]